MTSIRYLLSHNHDISDDVAPSLMREAFVKVFAQAFNETQTPKVQIASVEHPHWRCEIQTSVLPQEMGKLLANAVKSFREKTIGQALNYKILILGGLKTTPATSANPAALQPNEWGVDIVETQEDEAFLNKINWVGMTGDRDPAEIIQVIV